MPDDARRERMQVEQDVGQFWHFPSDYLSAPGGRRAA
jgi:hypothetical protein